MFIFNIYIYIYIYVIAIVIPQVLTNRRKSKFEIEN